MQVSRRHFLASGLAGAGAAVTAACSSAPSESPREPKLGLIFPVPRGVPEEGVAMYPTGLTFLTESLNLKTMTPDGYDAVIADIPPAAQRLKDAGAEGIVLMGTSLTFYKGAAFNHELTEAVKNASGLPATTMSTAVIEGLRQVGGRRIVAATAYNGEVNERLRVFLTESGFDVVYVEGMGIEAVAGVDTVTQDDLIEFGARVHAASSGADAMLVSCGGFRTLEIIAPLEERTKLPVVSSTPHALWAGARLVGFHASAPGFGRLLGQA
jgi:arylmalonate decarboxylase